MKKVFLVFGSLLFQYMSIAQSSEMNFRNLQKYWEYKERLHDKFVLIDWGGDGMGAFIKEEFRFERSGYSIPAVEYHPFSDQEWRMRGAGLGFGAKAAETGQLSEDNNLSENERFGVLRWGDGTVNLGHYLAVLATEYALLIQNEQTIQANRTLEELFLALQAYRRLDITANRLEKERASKRGITCANDALQFDGFSGWFIREDAHSTIWQEFNDPEINGAVSDYSKRNRETVPFHDYDHPNQAFQEQLGDVQPSQDQISFLLFGLALVRKYIPNDIAFNGENIIDMTTNIADGLVFGNKKTKILAHCISYPCEDRCVDDRGTDIFNYAGILNAHSYITNTSFNRSNLKGIEQNLWKVQMKTFIDLSQKNRTSPFLFNGLRNLLENFIDFVSRDMNGVNNYNEIDESWNVNLNMFMALTAAGGPTPFKTIPNNLDNIYNMWNLGELGKYIYPLAMYNIHFSDFDTEFFRSENDMYNSLVVLLNTASFGGGCTPCDRSNQNPRGAGFCSKEYYYNIGWCQAGETQWQTSNRFMTPPHRYNPTFKAFKDRTKPGRRTNGLDYMLAYNLFHLTFLNNLTPYFNTSEPEGNLEIQDGEIERVDFIVKTTVKENIIFLSDGIVDRHPLEDKNYLDSYSFKAYQNLFSSNLTIEYQLSKDEDIQISLINSSGQEIKKILNKQRNAGFHQEIIDVSNLTMGIYFIKILLDKAVIRLKLNIPPKA